MIKKVFVLAIALFLQGSSFCVPVGPTSKPNAPVARSLSGNVGCDISYLQKAPSEAFCDQVIFLSKSDCVFLSKKFPVPRSFGIVQNSKLRFIFQLLAALKKAQSTRILFKCPSDETCSFLIELTFAEGKCTKVVIHGSWPQLPSYILEFIKTCVIQKKFWTVGQKVFIAGGTLAGASLIGVAGILANNRAQEREANNRAQEREAAKYRNDKIFHRSYCRDAHCRNYGNFRCDGYGEVDPTLWRQKRQEREVQAAEETLRIQRLAARRAEAAREEAERRLIAIRRENDRRLAEENISLIARRLRTLYLHDKHVFIACTQDPVLRKPQVYAIEGRSCLAYDLSHFSLDMVKPTDTRIFVVGVGDLNGFGFNPALGLYNQLNHVLINNAQAFKDRLWKIIIVGQNDPLCDVLVQAFNGIGGGPGYAFACTAQVTNAELINFVTAPVPLPVLPQLDEPPTCLVCLELYPDSFYGSCECNPLKGALGHRDCLNNTSFQENGACSICRYDQASVVTFRHISDAENAARLTARQEIDDLLRARRSV